jgi:hypothetical protein
MVPYHCVEKLEVFSFGGACPLPKTISPVLTPTRLCTSAQSHHYLVIGYTALTQQIIQKARSKRPSHTLGGNQNDFEFVPGAFLCPFISKWMRAITQDELV